MEKKEVVQIGILGLRNADGSNGVGIPLYIPAYPEYVEGERRMIENWLKERAKDVKEQLDREDAKKLAEGSKA